MTHVRKSNPDMEENALVYRILDQINLRLKVSGILGHRKSYWNCGFRNLMPWKTSQADNVKLRLNSKLFTENLQDPENISCIIG